MGQRKKKSRGARSASIRQAPEPAKARPSPLRAHKGGRLIDVWVCLALFAGTMLLYIPNLSNEFLDYDDPLYVTQNPVVQQGLTWQGVRWAFTTVHFLNWLPLTWLSHMLDVQLWGLDPRGHHATSNLLHAANAAMVFLFLRRATGSLYRSAIVAILFAVHPLRVESVAWIAERKDVLAATFFLLVMLAYVAYARRPSVWRYGLILVLDALGLMSKTMLVTVPAVLLLLDYWPLRRARVFQPHDEGDEPPIQRVGIGRLLLEKVPLIVLTVVASAWTVVLQREGGATEAGADLTLSQRVGNALVSVPRYLWKTLYPVDLSAFYPHPGSWPAWAVVASLALIVLISAAAVWQGRRRPWGVVGWFWFVGMLIPVLGIIQVGDQSMADRYTYLPSIGLLVAVVWSAAETLRRFPAARKGVSMALAGVVVVLAAATMLQQRYWQTTLDTFEHALIVDERNYLAHGIVGTVYQAGGDDAKALQHFNRAIELRPNHFESVHNSAMSLLRLGRTDEAIARLRDALRIVPDSASAQFLLGNALTEKKDYSAATAAYAEAVLLDPEMADAHAALGASFARQGRRDEALRELQAALKLQPNHPGALRSLREFGFVTER